MDLLRLVFEPVSKEEAPSFNPDICVESDEEFDHGHGDGRRPVVAGDGVQQSGRWPRGGFYWLINIFNGLQMSRRSILLIENWCQFHQYFARAFSYKSALRRFL